MKKRDLFIVIVVLAFGIIYNFVETGEIQFYDGCSVDARGLRDKDHPNSFQQEEISYSASQISEIELDNRAGGIEITKSEDENIRINTEIRVYHRYKEDASEIEKEIRVTTSNSETNKLRIRVRPDEDFPYTRVRVFFKISVPETVNLDLWNRYGDIDVHQGGGHVVVDNKHGNISIKHIDGKLKVRHKHGKVVLREIGGAVDLNSRHSRVTINRVNSLKMNCTHAIIYIDGVAQNTNVEYIAHSSLKMANGQGLVLSGRHTKIRLKHIANGVKISNSHSSIVMEEISGDVTVKGKHCRIRMENVAAGDIIIKNSFNSVGLENISANTLDVLLSHGSLNIALNDIKERINIKNRHSRISLSYPKSLQPAFNMDLSHGKIKNTTDTEYTYVSERQRMRLNSVSEGPQFIINNYYGDVYLDYNHLKPVEKISPIEPAAPQTEIKAESEEFKKLEDDKAEEKKEPGKP
jgi:putative adhesin